MARLYYADATRLQKLQDENALSSGQGSAVAKDALEKMAKLIPSELIGLYLTFVGLVPLIKYEASRPWWYVAVFIFCWFMVIVYLNWQADKDKPKKLKIFISWLAFPFWAYAVSGGSVIPSYYDAAVASILLFAFTTITGFLPLK